MSGAEYPSREDLYVLARDLSDLLQTAIRTKGEMYADEWERMEEAQRKAHLLRHPETLSEEEVRAIVRRRDASADLLSAAKAVLADSLVLGFLKGTEERHGLIRAIGKAEGSKL